MSEPEPELRAEPIVAWRVWKIRESGLYSLHCLTSQQWPSSGPLEFHCHLHNRIYGPCDHEPFSVGGNKGCGIYALKSRHRAAEMANPYSDEVYGEILLWGKVWEHEDGYRAQYGKPLSIYTSKHHPNLQPLINKIGEKYQLDVTPHKRSILQSRALRTDPAFCVLLAIINLAILALTVWGAFFNPLLLVFAVPLFVVSMGATIGFWNDLEVW